jgi:hypothetical protein
MDLLNLLRAFPCHGLGAAIAGHPFERWEVLPQEGQNFQKVFRLHDEAVPVLEKTGMKGMIAIVFRGSDNILPDFINGPHGKTHALVVDAELAPVPGTAAGRAN